MNRPKSTDKCICNYECGEYIKELEKYCDYLEERNIAKRVKDKNSFYTDVGYTDTVLNVYGKCPSCGNDVNDAQDYCELCGQKLDWRG